MLFTVTNEERRIINRDGATTYDYGWPDFQPEGRHQPQAANRGNVSHGPASPFTIRRSTNPAAPFKMLALMVRIKAGYIRGEADTS